MIQNLLILFGILDLLCFIRFCKVLTRMFETIPDFIYPIDVISIFEILLIVSLILSGILSILKLKMSLLTFYFQFPLKITFHIFSFGFILKISGFPIDSISYKILLIVIGLMECLRLWYTIWIHRHYYKI